MPSASFFSRKQTANMASALVVEAREQGVREPLIRRRSFCLRHRVVGFQRIVDDDDVTAASRQRAADRCREAEPARCEFDLGLRVLVRPDAHIGERSSIPGDSIAARKSLLCFRDKSPE